MKKDPTSAEMEPTSGPENVKKDSTLSEKEPTSGCEDVKKGPTSTEKAPTSVVENGEKEPTSTEKERKNTSYEPSSKQIQKLILPALEEGAVEAKYPENANHPDQQYRLTGKALTWKNSNR